jgi:DNA-binding MarR family transcriptional regulator
MNQAAPPAVRELLAALLQVAHSIEGSLERSVEPCGLSLAKMGALQILSDADAPVPLGQLACRLCCVKSNVTQLIDRLEAEGLVRRIPDPADRRSVLALVTESGRERLEEARLARERAEAALLAGLDDAEITRLTALFQRVSARAGDAG